MPCYRPLSAWQTDEGRIVFRELPDVRRALQLPCGKCVGCLLERSRQWAVRCMHEASLYDASSFVTLTYDDEHLPDLGLNYKHFQLFMKRLRRKYGKARFFMSGEYGDQLGRPHYHALLFGVYFADRVKCSESGSGSALYSSNALSALWPYGHANVGDVTFESAAYIARYVVKKYGSRRSGNGPLRAIDSDGVGYFQNPEFSRMSLKPGIGADWWKLYGEEVLRRGNIVMRGVEMKPPRYYGKLCKLPGYDWVEFQSKVNPEDCTDERLRVREVVAQAKIEHLKRELE